MQTRRDFLRVAGGTVAALSFSSVASPALASGHRRLPDTISLPVGFRTPEGIAIRGRHAYVTSFANGDVLKVNLLTGTSRLLAPGLTGRRLGAAGIAFDACGRLFVAGSFSGTAWVLDPHTGNVLADYSLGFTGSFINDFVVTDKEVFVSDSRVPYFYRLPFGHRNALPTQAGVQRIPLGGDITYEDTYAPNVNGIAPTPDGKALLVVKTNTGKLYRLNSHTGLGTEVDLGGEDLIWGDGMLLEGRTLYVVQNLENKVAVVKLDKHGTTGRVVERRTDPRFDVITTMARFGDRFFLPSARLTLPTPEDFQYKLIAIPAGHRHRHHWGKET